jgi:hypothetical protein
LSRASRAARRDGRAVADGVAETDRPIAALLEDLSRRGLLDETLVIWGGDFGRLPIAQKGDKPGRDHNPHAFTVWMAGGSSKAGACHGATRIRPDVNDCACPFWLARVYRQEERAVRADAKATKRARRRAGRK